MLARFLTWLLCRRALKDRKQNRRARLYRQQRRRARLCPHCALPLVSVMGSALDDGRIITVCGECFAAIVLADARPATTDEYAQLPALFRQIIEARRPFRRWPRARAANPN